MMRTEVFGNATLILGDCREVLPGIESSSIDMVFTDPPYGHNNNNGDLIHRRESALGLSPKEGRPIANDGAEATPLVGFLFAESRRLLRAGCCCCCCCGGGGGPDPQFARWALLMDHHIDFKQMIVWDKGPMGMGWHYRRSYETVLVGMKPGAACAWFDQSDSVENIIRPGAYGIRKIIPSKVDHPTPKPWQLAAHFISIHTQAGEIVLDPFMGGGSTGEAAARLGRRFMGCEVDPVWFDYSCRRIESIQRQGDIFRDVVPRPKQCALL